MLEIFTIAFFKKPLSELDFSFQALQSALLEKQNKKSQKHASQLKLAWQLTLAREKREKNKKKSNNSFFIFIFLYRKTYILWENIFEVYIVTFALPFFRVAGYWKCSNTNATTDIHWFCRSHTFDSNGLFLLFIYFRQVPSI